MYEEVGFERLNGRIDFETTAGCILVGIGLPGNRREYDGNRLIRRRRAAEAADDCRADRRRAGGSRLDLKLIVGCWLQTG